MDSNLIINAAVAIVSGSVANYLFIFRPLRKKHDNIIAAYIEQANELKQSVKTANIYGDTQLSNLRETQKCMVAKEQELRAVKKERDEAIRQYHSNKQLLKEAYDALHKRNAELDKAKAAGKQSKK